MRKVRTASGATAVQIVSKSGGVRRIVEHLGSAHDETEVAALLEVGRQRIAAWQGQGMLDLESLDPAPGPTGLVGATGGLQALGPVLGRSARGVYPPGTGRGGPGVTGPLSRWFWRV